MTRGIGGVAAVVVLVGCSGPGRLMGWGHNLFGQVGDGTTVHRPLPVPVRFARGATIVSGGEKHTAALLGLDVDRWGLAGGWGTGPASLANCTVVLSGSGTLSTPVVVTLGDVVQLSSGTCHIVALKADGTVWAWGRNTRGELGNGTFNDWYLPIQVIGLTEIVAIAAGGAHTIALRSDGTVWSWGSNGDGQLGDGTTTNRATPVRAVGVSNIVAVSAGGHAWNLAETSLALASDGTAWWFAQYGGAPRLTPIHANNFTDIVSVASGGSMSLVLKADRTVWAWGFNQIGQLGDGTTVDRIATPEPVHGLSGVVALAPGRAHTLALLATGEVRSWGHNAYGQLGDGSFIDKLSPVPVLGVRNVAGIAAGENTSFAFIGVTSIPHCWRSGNQWICDGHDFEREILYCPPESTLPQPTPNLNLCPWRTSVPLCEALPCIPCLAQRNCPEQRFELRFDARRTGLRVIVIDDAGRVVGRTVESGFERRVQFHARPGVDYRILVVPGRSTPRGVPLTMDNPTLNAAGDRLPAVP